MTTIKTLSELAELINNAEEYPIAEVEAAIEANGWTDTSSLSDDEICTDGTDSLTCGWEGEEWARVLDGTPADRGYCSQEELEVLMDSRSNKESGVTIMWATPEIFEAIDNAGFHTVCNAEMKVEVPNSEVGAIKAYLEMKHPAATGDYGFEEITSTIETQNNDSVGEEIVVFHIGRGGKFHNPGYKTFCPDLHEYWDCVLRYDDLVLIGEEDDEFPEDKWQLIDGNGNILREGKEDILRKTGILDIDGEYDTYIAKPLEDCDENEMELIAEAYKANHYDVPEDIYKYCCDYLSQAYGYDYSEED